MSVTKRMCQKSSGLNAVRSVIIVLRPHCWCAGEKAGAQPAGRDEIVTRPPTALDNCARIRYILLYLDDGAERVHTTVQDELQTPRRPGRRHITDDRTAPRYGALPHHKLREVRQCLDKNSKDHGLPLRAVATSAPAATKAGNPGRGAKARLSAPSSAGQSGVWRGSFRSAPACLAADRVSSAVAP